jgi:general secretion pathway protein D
MNKDTMFRKSLALLLTACLVLPGAALGAGKSGKKNFKEGMKYEVQQQWDLAAQEFALAVAAEPNNPEYRLHLHRALVNASIMFLKRGDALAEQNDYASAYNAYRQAFAYDQTNELARVKMERMIEQQKGEAPSYNRIGNIVPTSGEITRPQRPRAPRDVVQNIEFKDTSLRLAITTIGRQLGLNVIFDDTFKDNTRFSISLQNVTLAKALDLILIQNKFIFEQLDRRTILIYLDNPTNRQRFERLYVKTFYLGNASIDEARNLLAQMLGGQRAGQIGVVKQLNALVVRDTPQNLRMIQEVIESIDKNRAEVVIDVEIYEVSHTTQYQIGNQLALSPLPVTETRFDKDGNPVTVTLGNSTSLDNLGGVGRAGIGAIFGNTFTPFLGGVGTILGLPPTSLSLLQTKDNSKLLARTQIHALDGESNETKVGRSVPVRVGTNYGYGGYGPTTPQPGVPGVAGAVASGIANTFGGTSGGLFDNIQYRDVGLVIKATPTITNEGYVQLKMDLESSNVEGASLTPTFTQRKLTTISRIQDGKTAVVAGVQQEIKGDSRTSIPVIGMVPILGRLFTTPKENSSLSDIIITVTPHVIRSAELKQDDHLAKLTGPMTGGLTQNIEDVVLRAQNEDEQDRRILAQQHSTSPEAQLNTPAQVAATTAPDLNPTPKVGAPSAPVNTAVTSAAASGLTPPPTVPAAAPHPGAASALQKASLTPEAGSQPAATNGDSSVKSAPGTPVASKSVSEVVDPAEGSPVAKGQLPKKGRAKEDEVPDLSEFYSQPTEPVAPAQVMPAKRPEGYDQALKEAAAKAAAAKPTASSETSPKPGAGKAPASSQAAAPDFIPPKIENPKQPVPLAVPKTVPRPTLKPKSDQPEANGATPPAPSSAKPAGAEANATASAAPSAKSAASTVKSKGDAAVGLSLMPAVIKQQVGKSFIVVVSVSGQATMTGAQVGLKFDPMMLQLKAVRDGGLLGNRPDLTHQVEGGNLLVTLQQAQDKAAPATASGRLLVVEFTALGPGQTAIEFNSSETQLTLVGNLVAQISATPAQVQISRETVSSLEK